MTRRSCSNVNIVTCICIAPHWMIGKSIVGGWCNWKLVGFVSIHKIGNCTFLRPFGCEPLIHLVKKSRQDILGASPAGKRRRSGGRKRVGRGLQLSKNLQSNALSGGVMGVMGSAEGCISVGGQVEGASWNLDFCGTCGGFWNGGAHLHHHQNQVKLGSVLRS